jgi:hypothetical protein
VVKSITGKSVGDFLHSSFKNTMFMGSSVGGMPIL